MSFIQYPNPTPVFPILSPLTWSVHKKPIMSSRAITAASGRETQLACAVFPRWAFTLSYGGNNSWLRDQTQNIVPDPTKVGFTELEQLSGLFLACLGSYGEFYYSDPDDNSRAGQPIATADGVGTTYQLYYNWGSGPFTPVMYIPVGGIQTLSTVYFNGVAQSAGLYSLDSTKTKIIFTSPPANGTVITADFVFYFRCRFLADNIQFSQWARNLWDTKEVRFESVKP